MVNNQKEIQKINDEGYLFAFPTNKILRGLSYGGYFKAKEMNLIDPIGNKYVILKNNIKIEATNAISYGMKEDKLLCILSTKIMEKYCSNTEQKKKVNEDLKKIVFNVQISRYEYMDILYYNEYNDLAVFSMKKDRNTEQKKVLMNKLRNVKKEMDSALNDLKNIQSISDDKNQIKLINDFRFEKGIYTITIDSSFIKYLSNSKITQVGFKNVRLFSLSKNEYILGSKIYQLFFQTKNIKRRTESAYFEIKKELLGDKKMDKAMVHNMANQLVASTQALAKDLGLDGTNLSDSLFKIKIIDPVLKALNSLSKQGYLGFEEVGKVRNGREEVIDFDNVCYSLNESYWFKKINIRFTLKKNVFDYNAKVDDSFECIVEKENLNQLKKREEELAYARKKGALRAEKEEDNNDALK